MVVVFTRFPIKPEFNDEYKEHLKEVVKRYDIKEQPGFLEMKLLAPKEVKHSANNNTFTIVTGWKDMKSFLDYTQSEAFRESHSHTPPIEWFAKKPEVEVYEVIE